MSTTKTGSEDDRALKEAHRAMWAMGDYDRFARATVWELGPKLVTACRITRGARVLDVATGTGNVAIRAAQNGAVVTGLDLTPEHFDAGRRTAAALGLQLEWIQGDAEALPFDDESFDIVTSCFGAMFAPNHQAVANEMVRVCRPGGTIGLMNFTPDGTGGEFFGLLAPYAPPAPPDAGAPLMWGDKSHVRALFGDRLRGLKMTRETYIERAPTAGDYCNLFRETFGPMVAIRANLAEEPEQRTALDRAFLEAVQRWNTGPADGFVEIPYDYLLVIGHR